MKDLCNLTKPRMNLLVLVTTLAGYYLAAPGGPDWTRLIPTLVGTAFAAAGASVLNQVIERDYDALMPRTANRPIPEGRIRPVDAYLFSLLLAATGISLLAIDVNLLTACLGVMTLVTYLLVYTPAKRFTPLCTLLGAVPGAIPAMMGCTAATGHITAAAVVLFLILFVWQIPHFLSIAILYRDDYAKGGFCILPVVDRNLAATARQIVLYCLVLVPVALLPVMLGEAGWSYFVASIVLNTVFTSSGIALASSRSRRHARWLFFISLGYLLCLLTAMVFDHRRASDQTVTLHAPDRAGIRWLIPGTACNSLTSRPKTENTLQRAMPARRIAEWNLPSTGIGEGTQYL